MATTSAADGDQATVAQNICDTIKLNTGGTGYSCANTGATVLIQAAAVGTAANGLPVVATGPTETAATNSVGVLFVTTATAGLSISSITIRGNELLSANITADGSQANTARMICEAINSGALQSTYIARSGSAAGMLINNPAFGECQTHGEARVEIKRMLADNIDNGEGIVVAGPAAATLNSGSIQINATAGATSIDDVTLAGVSIMNPKPLAIADGTQTTSIATSLAARLTGNGGCTATASSNVVTITGCTGALAVSAASAVATAVMKVTSTTHTYGADLGGITVGATSIAGPITPTTLTNGTLVSANATTVRNRINAGTGTHGFSAAVPVLSGSAYDITVSAPAGTAFNGQSFSFLNGTAVASGSATSPSWNFSINNATADNAIIDYMRCDPSDSVGSDEIYPQSSDASTGASASDSLQYTTALANGLNGAGANGYTYSCSYEAGSQNNQWCDVTGPAGVNACTSALSITKDATITIDNSSIQTAGSPGCAAITAPTWSFRLDGSSDNDSINNIRCGGVNTITGPINAGTGNGDQRRGLLASGMNAKGTNGYSYSCSNDTTNNRVNCTATGPVAAAACTNLAFTFNSGTDIKLSTTTMWCRPVPQSAAAPRRPGVSGSTTRRRPTS